MKEKYKNLIVANAIILLRRPNKTFLKQLTQICHIASIRDNLGTEGQKKSSKINNF